MVTIGRYPAVSIAAAFAKVEQIRAARDEGRSPKQVLAMTNPRMTLEEAYHRWERTCTWAARTRQIHLSRFQRFVMPELGRRSLGSIRRADVTRLLDEMVATGGNHSAIRIRADLIQVFAHAVSRDELAASPLATLVRVPTKPVVHRAAILEPDRAGALMHAIATGVPCQVTRTALELFAMLFIRSSELLSLEWTDIDFERARVTIPATRMKMKQAHIVPLPARALVILKELRALGLSQVYVFGSTRPGSRGHLTGQTVLKALRKLGFEKTDMSVHGFRAMARTLLAEYSEVAGEVVEAQMAHAPNTPLGTAYARATYLDRRLAMLEAWVAMLGKWRAEWEHRHLGAGPPTTVAADVTSELQAVGGSNG
jgi:integrase